MSEPAASASLLARLPRIFSRAQQSGGVDKLVKTVRALRGLIRALDECDVTLRVVRLDGLDQAVDRTRRLRCTGEDPGQAREQRRIGALRHRDSRPEVRTSYSTFAVAAAVAVAFARRASTRSVCLRIFGSPSRICE